MRLKVRFQSWFIRHISDYFSEFYNITQYSQQYVIGRNCRFLQGPETSKSTIGRLREGINNGEETCEMVLNYRRDGSPFVSVMKASASQVRGTDYPSSR